MSKKKPKVGLVARADNSGLGTMSHDFYRHLDFEKVMLITAGYECFYDRYETANDVVLCDRGIPTLPEIDQFLEGLDVVVTIETPYNWNLYSRAREKGIKTILIVMY